jgi:hypothetical protein
VIAELAGVGWKAGGITVDWSVITAVSADTTLPDDPVVPNGQKYLRFGQVMCMIGKAEVQTVTFTGGPTTGNAILTLPAVGDAPAQTAAAVPFNASAQAVADALNALSRIGPNGVSVSRSGAGSNADPYIYTVTFARHFGDVPQFTSTNDFGGGTTPTVTHGTSTAGTGNGKFGPYDPNATDGRQTLSRGDCYILNKTVVQNNPVGLNVHNSDNPAVFESGRVFKSRLLMTSGAHALAAGPTVAEFEAAFPGVQYVQI